MALGSTVSDIVVTPEEIAEIANRFEWVKKEKAKRLKEWKVEIYKSIEGGIKEEKKLMETLKKLEAKKKLLEDDIEKIKKIKETIKFIKKGKLTKTDAIEKGASILNEIMNEKEAFICPFCAMNCGSVSALKDHLKVDDDYIKKLNNISDRDSEYKKNASNIKELTAKIDSFPDEVIDSAGNVGAVNLTKEMITGASHHILSLAPFSYTMRINRMLNIADFNVNGTENCISMPTIDLGKFKELNGVAFGDLEKSQKQKIASLLMDSTGLQFHQGNHSKSPADGKDSYELLILKQIAKLEKSMLANPNKPCNKGAGSKTQNSAVENLKEQVNDTIGKIKDDLEMGGEGKYFVSELSCNHLFQTF